MSCEIVGCQKPAEATVPEWDGDGPETFDISLCREHYEMMYGSDA